VTIVIDTSALLALVKGEPGGDKVGYRLAEGVVSAVIFAECLSKLALQGYDWRTVRADLLAAGLTVAPVGAGDTLTVVTLHALARGSISLADRFCLALAMDRGLPVLTADRPWARLNLPVTIELVR